MIQDWTDAASQDLDDIYQGFVKLVVEAFFKAIKTIIEAVKGAVGGLDFNAIGGAIHDLWEAIATALTSVADQTWKDLATAYTDVAKVLNAFYKALLNYVISGLQEWASLVGPLKCGPVASLAVVGDLGQLVAQLNAAGIHSDLGREHRRRPTR